MLPPEKPERICRGRKKAAENHREPPRNSEREKDQRAELEITRAQKTQSETRKKKKQKAERPDNAEDGQKTGGYAVRRLKRDTDQKDCRQAGEEQAVWNAAGAKITDRAEGKEKREKNSQDYPLL